MIQESHGFATQSTNTEREEDLRLLEESTEVLDREVTRPMDLSVDPAALPGKEETPKLCADTVKLLMRSPGVVMKCHSEVSAYMRLFFSHYCPTISSDSIFASLAVLSA